MRWRLIGPAVIPILATSALGQQAAFLEPASASVKLGEPVQLSVLDGEARAPWPGELIKYFFARTAWTQENRDTLAPDADGGSVATWPTERPGVLMLGMELGAEHTEVDASAFRQYLGRVLDDEARGQLGAVPGTGEVEVVRTATAVALVRVESDGPWPFSVATSEIGMLGQIHPLMDPTTLTPGSDLAVELEAMIPAPGEAERNAGDDADRDGPARAPGGREADGAEAGEREGGVVIATNTTTGEVVRAVSNQSDSAIIRIAHAGRWRLEFHAVARAGEGPDAPFLVHTTTLTFDVRGEVHQ